MGEKWVPGGPGMGWGNRTGGCCTRCGYSMAGCGCLGDWYGMPGGCRMFGGYGMGDGCCTGDGCVYAWPALDCSGRIKKLPVHTPIGLALILL
jgi:hypothetical protein